MRDVVHLKFLIFRNQFVRGFVFYITLIYIQDKVFGIKWASHRDDIGTHEGFRINENFARSEALEMRKCGIY